MEKFYQLRPRFFVMFIIHYSLIALGAYCIVFAIKGDLRGIVGVFPIIIAGMDIARQVYSHVTITENEIIVSGELFYPNIQFKDVIPIKEITDVNLICSNKNSKKQRVGGTGRFVGPVFPKCYLEFVLKKGKTKWVYVSNYKKKQITRMLTLVNKKTGLNVDYDKLEVVDKMRYNKKIWKKP